MEAELTVYEISQLYLKALRPKSSSNITEIDWAGYNFRMATNSVVEQYFLVLHGIIKFIY